MANSPAVDAEAVAAAIESALAALPPTTPDYALVRRAVEAAPEVERLAADVQATVVAAEAGTSTSEFRATVVAAVSSALALGAAFGLHVDAAQQQDIMTAVGALVALVGTYTVSRGIRKRGTAG